jgi:hypothetical protein
MYAKNGGISLGALPSRVGVRPSFVPPTIRRLFQQVIFIAPLFWFMELLQNQLYWWFTGSFGWGYQPDASGEPTAWYSLVSFPLWVLTIVVFSLLDGAFERRGTAYPLRTLIAGAVGFGGELAAGFVCDRYLHRCLQIWPDSSLVYISLSALPFWCADYLIFHLLTRELRSAHAYRASTG